MSMQIRNKARGFSLIEVMIAVLVLSFGLLALAALQGELFRAGVAVILALMLFVTVNDLLSLPIFGR